MRVQVLNMVLDVITSRVVSIDAKTTVEDACDVRGFHFLLLDHAHSRNNRPYSRKTRSASQSLKIPIHPHRHMSAYLMCVFVHLLAGHVQKWAQYADVNAFLTLAATRHTLHPDELAANERVNQIVSAARANYVPVRLVSSMF